MFLKNYSEEDLLRNWADILFENNRDIDRLNDYPLTNGEDATNFRSDCNTKDSS